MDPSAVANDLNEVSVLLNVAHRILVAVRDDVEAAPELQPIMDDLNAAHDQLDLALERVGQALDRVDDETDRQAPEQRPAIH